LDLLEVAAAALAGAQQRLAQPCRRVVIHDAGRTLAADDSPVHGMARVAVDVADAAILQVHADATAARTHIAGRVLHLLGDGRRRITHLDRTRETACPGGFRMCQIQLPPDPSGAKSTPLRQDQESGAANNSRLILSSGTKVARQARSNASAPVPRSA